MTTVIYTPGVCNIGPAEIARGRNIGWTGLAISIVLAAVLILVHAPVITRIVVFLPAFVGASGFVQAASKFCVGFAQAGIFNFGSLGTTETITDPEAKKKDAKKATRLLLLCVGLAIVFTAIVYFI